MSPNRRRRTLYWKLSPLVFGVLAGCSLTAPNSSRFLTNFAPPEPSPHTEAFVLTDPPELEPSLYARESPLFLSALVANPGRSVEIEMRLEQSDERFQHGSELLAAGDPVGARAEFDRAVELLLGAPSNPPDRQRLTSRYEKTVEAIYRLELEAASQNSPDQEPAFDKSPLDDIVEMTFPLEPGLKGKVKEQLAATASQLPLEMADPVLSFIHYFSTPRGKKVLEEGLVRAGRYTPMIRRILDEEGLPQELIFLAQAESGFLPRAVSRKKATGMWQFILQRGREYGLKQTSSTDDRLDPEKATRAAARHLRDLYAQFGDWYLAMAAYNCGPLNVERAIQRTGYADFWELSKRNVLPKDTRNYVPIILAMTIMAKNPGDYGLDEITPEPPLQYDTITLTAPSHLALIADIADQPLSEIRALNPAILKLVAPAGYEVHVPKGDASSVLAAMEAIPPERRASWRLHRVSPNDTVSSIAKQYKTTTKSIAAANGGAEIEPEEGELLVVPVAYPGGRPVPVRRTATKKKAAPKPAPKPSSVAQSR